ncbi:MAG: LysR family transcriptional regulator [Gammaproteobacteria bacterium]|nr:LysR family transcriptional regulator [Gammaproteobacteria bacterium]
MKNLPTDLLRAYVTVIKEGGFSRAGKKLGRSQPAVSLQINRLEELVGSPIMIRNGRSFSLTEEGDILLDYAQRILRLNDEALLRLSKPDVTGKVRLGIPHEFAISYLPGFLTGFAEAYPGVELEVISELSSNLLFRQSKQELDLVIAIHKEFEPEPATQGWHEKLVWVTDSKHNKTQFERIPLVVAPHGCVYRYRMLQALDKQLVPWRIVYTGTSYGGICAAVTAGLGVTVLAKNTVPKDLEIHEYTHRLPQLEDANVELHYDPASAEPAVLQLVEYINKVSRQFLTG